MPVRRAQSEAGAERRAQSEAGAERRAQSEAGAERRAQSEAGTITDVRGETPARGVSTFWRAARFPLLAKCGVFINVETPLAGVRPGASDPGRHAYGRQTGASCIRASDRGVRPGRHACARLARGVMHAGVRPGASCIRASDPGRHAYGRQTRGVMHTASDPGPLACAPLTAM